MAPTALPVKPRALPVLQATSAPAQMVVSPSPCVSQGLTRLVDKSRARRVLRAMPAHQQRVIYSQRVRRDRIRSALRRNALYALLDTPVRVRLKTS